MKEVLETANYFQKILNNETGYENQQQTCVFGYKDYHPLSHCKFVTNKDARIDILLKYSKCYLCLKGISPKFVNRLTFAESAVESITFQFVNLKKKMITPKL